MAERIVIDTGPLIALVGTLADRDHSLASDMADLRRRVEALEARAEP